MFSASKRLINNLGRIALLFLLTLPFAPAHAQGTVTTTDGLSLSLSSTGGVTNLSLSGTDYHLGTMPSGFGFRTAGDVYNSNGITAFGGSVASDGSGGYNQTATVSNLSLAANFKSIGNAIKVHATVTNSDGNTNRGFELSFRLPINASGWTWDDDLSTPRSISSGTVYSHLDTIYAWYSNHDAPGGQTHSLLPWADIHNSAAEFALGIPAGKALLNRFSYDTTDGFKTVWDLGTSVATNTTSVPSNTASVDFWIYSADPTWGFRSAAAKYYPLEATVNANAWSSNASIRGAWISGYSPKLIPNVADYGIGYDESPVHIDWDDTNAVAGTYYTDPQGWFRDMAPLTTQPTDYNVLLNDLNSDASSGVHEAQATQNAGDLDWNGQYCVYTDRYFWYGPFRGDYYQIYPTNPDNHIATPNQATTTWTDDVKPILEQYVTLGTPYKGVFIDDLTPTFMDLPDSNQSHWAVTIDPLEMSYRSGYNPAEPHMAGAIQFLQYLKGQIAADTTLAGGTYSLQGNIGPGIYVWAAPYLDVVGGESNPNDSQTSLNGVETDDRINTRRAMSYGKLMTNLMTVEPSESQVSNYLKSGLELGYFPGFNASYWNDGTAVTRDHAKFTTYMPLIKDVDAAGWQPVPYATSSVSKIRLERFGSGTDFYVTAQNNNTGSATFQVTLDGANLGFNSNDLVVATEKVNNVTEALNVSGTSATFSDTHALSAGDVACYHVTVTHPRIPNPNFVNGVGTWPDAWTATNVTNATWSWQSSTDPTVKWMVLTATGSTNVHSGNLKSNLFALSPSTTYTFSGWTKGTNISGTYPFDVYIVECDSSGNILTSGGVSLQHAITGDFGTTDWAKKTVQFTTDSRCAQAYVYANFYATLGTAYLTELGLSSP